MKQMGRKHRQFFRICACDSRSPRDGRVIEELGTYDPQVPDTDARTLFNNDRLSYWLGVGAKPSEKVAVLIKKYGPSGSHTDQQQQARERLSMPKVVPDAGEPKWKKEDELAAAAKAEADAQAAAAAAAAAAEAPAETAAEATEPAAETSEPAAE
jgi:small subunit ribosomal protein S16